jgi:L-lactate utilization protein LutC
MLEIENPKITTTTVSSVRLTKKGLPDKRAESSKKNLEKGKSIIKQALQKIKEEPITKEPKKKVEFYSSDEYSTDEDEEELKPMIEQQTTEPLDDYKFTFEKKFDELKTTYNSKINLLEQETKMTKEELKLIKEQNQALKKSITSSFKTHAGIMNQEMYLKF